MANNDINGFIAQFNKSLEITDEWLNNKNLLFEYVEKNKTIPNLYQCYDDTSIEAWYSMQKTNITNKKNDKYNNLSQNKIIMNDLDKNIFRSQQHMFDSKMKLLFEYVNINKRLPELNTIHKIINIGSWFYEQIKNIRSTSNETYIKLSKNLIIKNALDIYIEKNGYTFDEMLNALFEYIEINNNLPPKYELYKDKDIGLWLKNAVEQNKTLIHDLYFKYITDTELIKKFNVYFENANSNLKKRKIQFAEQICENKSLKNLKNSEQICENKSLKNLKNSEQQ